MKNIMSIVSVLMVALILNACSSTKMSGAPEVTGWNIVCRIIFPTIRQRQHPMHFCRLFGKLQALTPAQKSRSKAR